MASSFAANSSTSGRGSSSAPFSFHCTICYDAFNLTDRPPVVLPCGHTYVCLKCSKRLKRCMECRTSLFMPMPSGAGPSGKASPPLQQQRQQQQQQQRSPRYGRASYSPPPSSSFSRYGGRGSSPSSSRPPPPKAAEQVPLPLPRNLVMVTLMEAAQRETDARKEDANAAASTVGGTLMEVTDSDNDDENDDDENDDDGSSSKCYESGDDDEKVLAGIGCMSAAYGTYVVRAREGLTVIPHEAGGDRGGNSGGNGGGDASDEDDTMMDAIVAESQDDICYSSSSSSNGSSNGNVNGIGVCGDSFTADNFNDVNTSLDTSTDSTEASGTPSLFRIRKLRERRVQKEKELLSTIHRHQERGLSPAHPPQAAKAERLSRKGRLSDATQKNVMMVRKEEPALRVEYGTKVQVVDVKYGAYYLARRKGYILANESQLVKVDVPHDKACQIEGMMSTADKQLLELRLKLRELERIKANLSKNLERAMLSGTPKGMNDNGFELPSVPTPSPPTTPDFEKQCTPTATATAAMVVTPQGQKERTLTPPPTLSVHTLGQGGTPPSPRSPPLIVGPDHTGQAGASDRGIDHHRHVAFLDAPISSVRTGVPMTPVNSIDNSELPRWSPLTATASSGNEESKEEKQRSTGRRNTTGDDAGVRDVGIECLDGPDRAVMDMEVLRSQLSFEDQANNHHPNNHRPSLDCTGLLHAASFLFDDNGEAEAGTASLPDIESPLIDAAVAGGCLNNPPSPTKGGNGGAGPRTPRAGRMTTGGSVGHFYPRTPEHPVTPSSPAGLDFRTGLSGHRALTSFKVHANRSTTPRGKIRMMGEHKGLGFVRPGRKQSRPQSPNVLSSSIAAGGGSQNSSSLSTKTW